MLVLKSIPNNSKNNLKLNLEIIPNDNNLDEVIYDSINGHNSTNWYQG